MGEGGEKPRGERRGETDESRGFGSERGRRFGKEYRERLGFRSNLKRTRHLNVVR